MNKIMTTPQNLKCCHNPKLYYFLNNPIVLPTKPATSPTASTPVVSNVIPVALNSFGFLDNSASFALLQPSP